MTKCTFHKYGPSGTITTHDGLCILALNIINEKIYVFLWFWFIGVAIFSTLALIYTILILAIPSIRVRVLMKRLHNRVNKKMVEDILSCPNHSWVDKVCRFYKRQQIAETKEDLSGIPETYYNLLSHLPSCILFFQIGDYWVIYLLSKNLPSVAMKVFNLKTIIPYSRWCSKN